MKYGCIGEHLKHSFSKEIHNEIADYQYEICEIPRDGLDSFMRKADFFAINVTIPYKEAVIPYLYHISPIAAEIGAVNTVVNRNGKLYGYNTDFYGMTSLIKRMNLSLDGKKVAVLGTGGTSKTARAVARSLGASEIFCVSRRKGENTVTYEELYEKHADTQIIINCTPVGMFPNSDASPADPEKLPRLEGVVDAVYNPLNTELIRRARRRNINAQCGLFMLVAQAVRASEFFLDTSYPPNITEQIYHKILKEKENIVLTGMPSCGKSTVGKILSRKLGRKLYDTDTLIEEELGCSVRDVFEKKGEKYFRDTESRVIGKISEENGLIIATGGGSILRQENVEDLNKNSVIFFIDRSPENLMPTGDRPLASSFEAIKKRYDERYETYCRTAHIRIDGDHRTPEEVADLIAEEFLKYENICN